MRWEISSLEGKTVNCAADNILFTYLPSLVLHLRPRSAHDQRCFAFPLRLYLRLSLGLRTPFPFIFSAGQSF